MLQTVQADGTSVPSRQKTAAAAVLATSPSSCDRQNAAKQQSTPTPRRTAPKTAATSPVIVIAIGQCGITVAHNFFSQFGTQPHLFPAFFVQVKSSTPSTQDPASSPSTLSAATNATTTPTHNPSLSAPKPFHALTPAERDARIQRTLAVMLPTLSPSRSSTSSNSRCTHPPPSPTAQYIPRAILLDTEPKVVSHIVSMGGPRPSSKSPRSWRYHPKCSHWRAAGAANNWAYGYFVHGHDMWQTIVRGVRAQVKLASVNEDGKVAFLVLHSVAGGTGSGVGTYVTEQLRHEYPESVIVNQVVWPFASGEVIVQHYNVILTLSRLKQVSNLTLILFNNHLHQICTSRLAVPSPGFDDLNPLISHTLKQILNTISLRDLATTLKPSHLPPFALVYHVPQVPRAAIDFTSITWHGLLKPLKQMVVTHSPIDEQLDWCVSPQSERGNKVDNMVVVLKGNGAKEAKAQMHAGESGMNDGNMFVSGHKARMMIRTDTKESGVVGIDKWAAVVCTSTALQDHLADSLQAVVKMHTCGAYSHHYTKYGLSTEAMETAIAQCYQMLMAYRTA